MSTLLTNASIMSFPSFFSDVANIIGSTILTKQTYTDADMELGKLLMVSRLVKLQGLKQYIVTNNVPTVRSQ